jgi:GABA permease
VSVLGIAAILLLMLRESDTRTQLAFTAALTAVLALVGYVRQRQRPRTPIPEDA